MCAPACGRGAVTFGVRAVCSADASRCRYAAEGARSAPRSGEAARSAPRFSWAAGGAPARLRVGWRRMDGGAASLNEGEQCVRQVRVGLGAGLHRERSALVGA